MSEPITKSSPALVPGALSAPVEPLTVVQTSGNPPVEPISDRVHQDRSPRGSRGRSSSSSGGRSGGLITGLVVLAAFGAGYLVHGLIAPSAEEGDAESVTSVSDATATVWTCSMHPQIRQPNPGLCPLCAMDLIPASSGDETEAESLRELSISREARELLNIETAPVERQYATATIRMLGKVDYDETRLSDISSWIPGRLDRLFVDYTGIEVQQGDHMVSIYSPELYSAQAELIRARQASQERRSPTAAMSAERLLESAREKLRLWGLSDEQIRQIEQQEKPSDHMTIYSPMSGIVIEKNLQEGAYVETGSKIYTIADLNQVWVLLDAYESDLVWLRYGQQIEFTSEAYPGEVFLGRIAFIDPVLNPRTRTVKVRVDVPNPHGKLKPEMFVNGRVRAQVANDGKVMVPELAGKWICRMHPGIVKDLAGDCDLCEMPLVRTESLGYVSADAEAAEPLVVPASAVLQTGTRAIVYIERGDADRPTYEGREIVLGPRAGDVFLVRSGLGEGERVVVNGNFKLDSALQLSAKPSMMSPEASDGGGGHDHGGHDARTDSGTGDGSQQHLSMAVAGQLARVLTAAREVTEALEAGDREAIRASLRSFEEALDGVDAGSLDGPNALQWKELVMRLRNGAVEARWAASEPRLREALNQLQADVGRLQGHFGLSEESGVMLAGAPFDAPRPFRQQLGRVWRAYIETQQALANDDPKTARLAVRSGLEALEAVEMSLLAGQAHDAWMTLLADFQSAINPMSQTDDLEALREHFETWSLAMTPAIASFGLAETSGPVYQLYCSMAFDFRGASWLQAGDEVRNPYFGETMLECANEVSLFWEPPSENLQEPQAADVPEPFLGQMDRLWDAYLELHQMLASDDLDRASKAADKLAEVLESIKGDSLEGPARAIWEREQENLNIAIGRMAKAEGLEPLRASFALLSEALPTVLQAFGHNLDGPIYRMQCPMAFNNRGAAWLQADDEVRNPYFGATMLGCADKVEPLLVSGARETDREDLERE